MTGTFAIALLLSATPLPRDLPLPPGEPDEPAGTLAGSAHDFEPSGSGIPGAACRYCHVAGGGMAGAGALWHRTAPAGSYRMYSAQNSATFVLGPGDVNGPRRAMGAVSLACLSCHDGALGSMAPNQQPSSEPDADRPAEGAGTFAVRAVAVVGSDLADDHPISFTYDSALARLKGNGRGGGLRDPAVSPATGHGGHLVTYRGGSPAAGAPDTVAAQMLFPRGGVGPRTQVECATCHEPHAQGMRGVPGSNYPFLIKSNDRSELCLTCHAK